MRIINVITITKGTIDEIVSFGIFEDQISEVVIGEAEKLFIEKVMEIGFTNKYAPVTDEEEYEKILADGYFVLGDRSVCINWSNI